MKRPIILLLIVQVFATNAFAVERHRFNHELPILAGEISPRSIVFTQEKFHPTPQAANDDRWIIPSQEPKCNGPVFALNYSDGNPLYIGGAFSYINGAVAHGIAAYLLNGDTNFVEIGGGVNGEVYCIFATGSQNNDIFIGGNFSLAGETPANNIAHWTGTNWESLGSGTDSTVLSLDIIGDILYVGGNFKKADDKTVNYIATWNIKTKQWNPIVVGEITGVNGGVAAIAHHKEGDIYIGGGFNTAGDKEIKYIARFSKNNWFFIDTTFYNPVSFGGYISAIRIINDNIIYAGSFASLNGRYVAGLTRDGHQISGINHAFWGPVYALSNEKSRPEMLLFGGDFNRVNNFPTDHVCGPDIETWGSGVDGTVFAMAGELGRIGFQSHKNTIFVGGYFQTAGGKESPFFAAYDAPVVSVAQQKPKSQDIKIFPNPCSSFVTVESDIKPNCITIFDILGRSVLATSANPDSPTTFDCSTLAEGTYSMQLSSNTDRAISKFIVSR